MVKSSMSGIMRNDRPYVAPATGDLYTLASTLALGVPVRDGDKRASRIRPVIERTHGAVQIGAVQVGGRVGEHQLR